MATYPDTKTAVGGTTVRSRAALRATAAYIMTVGAALGTIIPTIMTVHIRKISAKSITSQLWIRITDIGIDELAISSASRNR